MDDLSSKISSILSDPQALEQIKGLGEMLGLSGASATSSDAQVHKEQQKSPPDMLSSLSSVSSSDSLSMLTKFAPLLSDLNKEDDTTRLLFALRPFLSYERQKKLDEAGKLIKMMKLLPVLKQFNILDSFFQ